ncbi:MAG TPA: response regulator [Pyrinomonadaceae bacterium]|nr:response regulator [Pyrinomonadaceae bacterium]
MEGNVPQDRALVVDDHEDTLEMLAMLLRRSGYVVETASSAFEALDFYKAGDSFCLIISDIGMPRMNGYELARKLRQMPQCKTTLMVAVTGFSAYDDRRRALESGFDELVTKPIGPVSFLASIARLRSKKK